MRTARHVVFLAIAACSGGRGVRSVDPVRDPPRDTARDAGVPVTDPNGPAARLVRDLVAKRPRTMSELEAIVGPIAMSFDMDDHENMGWLSRPREADGEFTQLVPRLHVRYYFDVYHQEPTRRRDVSLESYTVEVRGNARDAQGVLHDKLGASRTVVDGPITYAVFHPFYLTIAPQAPDRFFLAWYAEVPRFAIPEPDAHARAAWLQSFAALIASAQSIDEIEEFCKAAPADAGIKLTGTLNSHANPSGRPIADPRDYWIEFVPPVNATILATAFGWGAIVGVSHDVHMSSWHVEKRGAGWMPTSGAATQWQLEAGFGTGPSGKSTGRDARDVGADDEIRTFAVSPRYK